MNSTKGATYPRKSGKPRRGIVATNSGMFMSLRQPLMTKVQPNRRRASSSSKSCHCAAKPSVEASQDDGDPDFCMDIKVSALERLNEVRPLARLNVRFGPIADGCYRSSIADFIGRRRPEYRRRLILPVTSGGLEGVDVRFGS